MRVVVIDDVQEIREIVQMMLESDGRFRVVGQAADGAGGIAVVARESPDVVLLDIDMPGMNGWEALPAIKEAAPDAAVVIFSGEDDGRRARRTAIERGAHAFLQKGVEARRLAPQLLHEIGQPPERSAAARRETLPLVPDEPADVTRHRLLTLIERADEAIFARALDGTVLSWSPAAERIFGYSADEIVGVNVARLLPDESRGELEAILERLRAGEEVRLDTRRKRKDGQLIDVDLTVTPVRDATGAVVGGTTIVRDRGERDRRDRAFARAIAQLDRQNRVLLQANEELDRFAYVASHDLAQPLQVMYGYVELLQSEYGSTLDPTATQWLGLVANNLERMRRLVRDLLSYARLGAAAPGLDQVDCNELVQSAIADLEAIIAERGATISASPLPVVLGDKTQLGQVFQNLIANAIKHTPPERAPVVQVSASSTGEQARIDVLDNGEGVRDEDRVRIFEMFQRSTTVSEGSGIGLAISKRVIERHGGSIWVEPRTEGGSRFSFTLRTAG